MGEKRNLCKVLVGYLEERDHLEHLGVDGGNIKEGLKKLR
jgi:hypothetical protein